MPTLETAPDTISCEIVDAAESASFDKRPKLSMIEHGRISPSPLNPRKHFDQAALEELADSIKVHGIQQPIVVRQHNESRGQLGGNTVTYSIVMGERRWRAAALAGMLTVPALVRTDLDDLKHAELAMEENVRRRDLSPIEEAHGYAKLMEMGKTQAAIGESVGVGQSRIANLIRLLELPKDVQERIESGDIKAGHGIALLRWKDYPAAVSLIASKITGYNFSVRTLEAGQDLGYNLDHDLQQAKNPHDGLSLAARIHDYRVHPVCNKCPFHANFHGRCLKPAHYAELLAEADAKDKQDREEALATKHAAQEAARKAMRSQPATQTSSTPVVEAAPPSGIGSEIEVASSVPVPRLPLLSVLPFDSYERLDQKLQLPSGCNGHCDCSGVALDARGDQVRICTKPRRFAGHVQADEALKSSEVAVLKKRLLADCLLITGGINPGDETAKLALAVDALLVERSEKIRKDVFLHHRVLDQVTPAHWPLYASWDKDQNKIRLRLAELAALPRSVLVTMAAEIVLRRELISVTDAAYGDATTLGYKAQWLHDQRFPAEDMPTKDENIGTSTEPADDAGISTEPRLYPCADCKTKGIGAFYVDCDGYEVQKGGAFLGDWVCWVDMQKRQEAAQAEQVLCANCKEPLTTGAFESAIAAAAARQNPLRMNTGELLLPDGRAFCKQCGPMTGNDGDPLPDPEPDSDNEAPLCACGEPTCLGTCTAPEPWEYDRPDGLPIPIADTVSTDAVTPTTDDAVEVFYDGKWLSGTIVGYDAPPLVYVLVAGDSGPSLFDAGSIRPANWKEAIHDAVAVQC